MSDLRARLSEFAQNERFLGNKGPLCVALVVTQHARNMGLPLDPEKLVTEAGTQVLGLGRSAVKKILSRLGETRKLASEAGRTSRGSRNKMRAYVKLLNELHVDGLADLNAIDSYWLEQVQTFFEGKPFRIHVDTSRSLRSVVRDVFQQAVDRQRKSPGMQYAGAVLQHLVGAKVDCALGPGQLQHNSFSTSDEQVGRHADFVLGDVAIHVTTAPSEALLRRCLDNLDSGYRPIIVTLRRGVETSEQLAENFNIQGRVDAFEIEQFMALNIYELGKFEHKGRREAVGRIVARYNEIVDEVETDPSLKIEFRD